jgi:hypothetical protein
LLTPDLGALVDAREAFRSAQANGDDIDPSALALTRALNAVRDKIYAAVAGWWSEWAASRARDAGVEALDILEPEDQERARRLTEDLRRAASNVPGSPSDVSLFRNQLAALVEIVTESNVAELPVRVSDLLRAIGSQQLRLSQLAAEDLEALKDFGYAEKLSIRWGGSQN